MSIDLVTGKDLPAGESFVGKYPKATAMNTLLSWQ